MSESQQRRNRELLAENERLWQRCCNAEFRVDQKFALRREVEEILGVASTPASDEQLSRGIEALRALRDRAQSATSEVVHLRAQLAVANAEIERLRIERDARTELECDGDCDKCGHTSQCYAENELRIARAELVQLRAQLATARADSVREFAEWFNDEILASPRLGGTTLLEAVARYLAERAALAVEKE